MAASRWAKVKFWLTAVFLTAVVAFALSPVPSRQKNPDRIPVHFWHMWSAEWEDVVNRIAEEFNASQDVYEVIPLSTPGAYNKYMLSMAGGSPPDLIATASPFIPTWAAAGMLIPFDELMSPEDLEFYSENAFPIVLKLGMYEGLIYGMPIGMNGFAMYVRTDHFEEAGIDLEPFPETLEELVEITQPLNRYDRHGNLTRLGFLPGGLWHLAPMFGGGFYDWETDELTLNTPENLRALEFIVAGFNRVGRENVNRFSAGLDTRSAAAGWPFIGGAHSIVFDGQWRVEQIRKYAPDLEYTTLPMPPPTGGVPLAGWSNGNFMVVPRGAKNPSGAWAFTRFWNGLADPERAAKFHTWGGWLPPTPQVANSRTFREYIRENPEFETFMRVHASEYVKPIPPVPFGQFLQGRVWRAEDAAVRGTLSPAEALRQLEAQMQNEIERRRALGHED